MVLPYSWETSPSLSLSASLFLELSPLKAIEPCTPTATAAVQKVPLEGKKAACDGLVTVWSQKCSWGGGIAKHGVWLQRNGAGSAAREGTEGEAGRCQGSPASPAHSPSDI